MSVRRARTLRATQLLQTSLENSEYYYYLLLLHHVELVEALYCTWSNIGQ